MDGVAAWVINLDRAPDRLARVSARLQALGLPFTRLPAVDARQLLPEQQAALDTAGHERRHGKTPVPGELGCYLSHVAVLLIRCTGSSAYLVNRRAAQAYLRQPDGLLPMQLPYDHVFDQGWRFGLQVRLVTPRPCGHDQDIPTTIAAPPSARRKLHWTRRLPAFAWRLRNESRRLVYGLGQLARERLR